MARTGFFHHIGSLLLFAATILLVVVSVSAPVANDIALLKVRLANATDDAASTLNFGTFGYCVVNTAAGRDACTGSHIGYDPVAAVLEANNLASLDDDFSSGAQRAARTLSRIMILHPIAAGISFLAFLVAVGAGFVGSLIGSIISVVAFVVSAVVLVTDFVLFQLIRRHVNNSAASSSTTAGMHAQFGVAIWLLVAGAACALLGAIVVFFSCCSGRSHRSRDMHATKVDPTYVAPARTRRGRFF